MTTTENNNKSQRMLKSLVTYENAFIVKIDNDWPAEGTKERKITGQFQMNDVTQSRQWTSRFDCFDVIAELQELLKDPAHRVKISGYPLTYKVKDKETGQEIERVKLVIMGVSK